MEWKDVVVGMEVEPAPSCHQGSAQVECGWGEVVEVDVAAEMIAIKHKALDWKVQHWTQIENWQPRATTPRPQVQAFINTHAEYLFWRRPLTPNTCPHCGYGTPLPCKYHPGVK